MNVLTIASLNCQSIRNKILKVMGYLEESNVHIACIQETWLSAADNSICEMFKEFGYKSLKYVRTESKGG